MIFIIFSYLILLFSFTNEVFARGGGGGSGGGGGGGGGSGSSGGGSFFNLVIIFIIFVITTIYAWYKRNQKIKKAQQLITKAESQDSSWDEDILKKRVSEVFYSFQKDWSEFNIDRMKSYLTEDYYKRMVLELNVLKNEHRQNLMKDFKIHSLNIWGIEDNIGSEGDSFTMEVQAWANDSLIDTDSGQTLYSDINSFTEYWSFVREGTDWKLNLIKQATEDVLNTESKIVEFARRNNFYFDPDFGWLMMPNKGVVFRQNNFKTSDINNHVIGYLKGKIVEFYTFIPGGKYSSNYLVAQTVLPVNYNDILVRRKRWFWNFASGGLRRIETESNDFNKKFCLYAHKNDQINSFVLLAPDFMEEVYNLTFELNIEIVGSFLYFYVKGRKNVNEDEMMRLLSKAFDSMHAG